MLAAGTFLCCGCWVKQEAGKKMQADIAAMQMEMEVVKKAHAEQKGKLAKRIQQADQKIAELQKVIEEYRRATGRNAADVGVDLERLKSEIMQIRGRLEVNEHRLGIIENRLSIIHKDLDEQRSSVVKREEDEETRRREEEEKKKKEIEEATRRSLGAIERPEKVEDFYKLAYGMLDAGQHKAARILFEELLAKWPKSAYADNALYWIGESYYAEQNYREAALTFQKVRKRFPKGDKSPDALLKLGYCFYAMEMYKESLPFLSEFVQSYPGNRMAAAARKKIRNARRRVKSKRRGK